MSQKQLFRFGFVLCLMSSLSALEPGDIAFVEYNADDTDNFKFVCLVDISENTEIKFTDNGWKSDDTWRTGEGIITWTAPGGGVSLNTVVNIDKTPSTSHGSVNESGSLDFNATHGDQIIAYQDTSDMIAALNNNNSEDPPVWQSTAEDANTSAIPVGLTNGTDCAALDEYDNTKYNGTTSGTKEDLLAEINDYTNWTGDDDTRQTFDGSFSVQPVAITLLSFNAHIMNDNVVLSWHTGSEINQAGYDLYRSQNQQGPWQRVNDRIIPAENNAATGGQYQFIDQNSDLARFYRLASIETSGHIEYYGPIKASRQSAVRKHLSATACSLHPCYPNPFNPRTTLTYEIAEPEYVRLAVFDMLGRCVRTFVDQTQQPGIYSQTWHGRDDAGNKVAAGVFLLVMRTQNEVFVQKVVLLE